ncbi:MAG: hypothetical protein HYW49_04595 [Deltaproteobacteria bacterium]|nr:hypothetical protein [Deltaproteobacteria bacterium]
MRETLIKLEQVQELDLQIDAILKKQADFPARLTAYDAEIKAIGLKIQEKKKITDELDKGRRQQIGALELNEDRAKRSQEKLEHIKTNQEYMALQKEVESLKRNSDIIRENAKRAEDEIAKHKVELDAFETAITEIKVKHDAESVKIAEETKSMADNLTALRSKREEFATCIEARYLTAYDRIRAVRQGIGVAIATAGGCRGCNMKLPPQMFNELQRLNEIRTCPNCKRILFYKDAGQAQGASPAAASA